MEVASAAASEEAPARSRRTFAASSPMPGPHQFSISAPVSDSYSNAASSSVPATPTLVRKRLLDPGVKTKLGKEKAKSRKTQSDDHEDSTQYEDDDVAVIYRKKIVGRKVTATIDNVVNKELTDGRSTRMDVDDETLSSRQQAKVGLAKEAAKQVARPTSPESAAKERLEKEAERKDSSYEEPTIGSLGGVTEAKFENLPAEVLGSKVIDLAREIETLRQKCSNIQGRISGRMKRNLHDIQEGIMALVGKALASGDPSMLKIQNKELIVKVQELERENGRLKEGLRQSSGGADSPPRKRKVEKAIPQKMAYIEDT